MADPFAENPNEIHCFFRPITKNTQGLSKSGISVALRVWNAVALQIFEKKDLARFFLIVEIFEEN